MIADIAAIVWKEWRELVFHPSSRRGTIANVAVLVLVLGVVLPAQVGRPWLESALYLVYWAWVSTLLVSTLIADSFAGERERHTLETLLASRLRDDVILLGKIAASVIYGWSVSLIILVAGVIVVNLTQWTGDVVLYRGTIALGAVLLSLLLSLTTASAGALASLRAATVRQAQATLNLAIMIAFLLPALGFQVLPETTRSRLFEIAAHGDLAPLLLGVSAVLVLVNLVLLAIAGARFQRSQLLLD